METHQVNRIAVGTCAKAVCEALRKFGKRCTVRWVNQQCEASLDVKRIDYYGAFWRWYEAIYVANREGAEFLFEDFRARVQAMRDFECLASADWRDQIARCEGEHSDIIRAAFLSSDAAQLKIEIAQDIAEKRLLLAMLEAQHRQQPEQRAA